MSKFKLSVTLVVLGVFQLAFEYTYAQTSPYSLSPKWYIGRRAGINFTSGSPALMSGGAVDGTGQEASTTMCDSTGNVLFYSDSYRLYNGTNSFVQNVNGGTSSTNSSISFPDPADPDNYFYFVTANQDPGGGGDNGATIGIYWYKIQKTGTSTINVVSGPNFLAANNEVTEQLYASPDNNGGYWVVAHQGGGSGGNQFWSWNFTSTGVGSKQASSIAGTESATFWQGSIKINKCQNRLAAVFWTGKVEVYDWDNTTGTVTNLYRSYTLPSAFVYGCEFSPNGNILYFTSLVGNQLYQYDLTTNTVTSLTGGSSSNNITEMGTLQIGPDDKIYVTNVANYSQPTYIGVINNPDISGAGCNYNRQGFILNNSVGNWPNIYRGIANQAWINPKLDLDTIGNCKTLTFNYDFRTYFNDNITILTNSEEWDFGDGSGFISGLGSTPSHTYANGGTYTITLRVTDATCNKIWTKNTTLTVNDCNSPPPTNCVNDIIASISPLNGTTTIDEANPSIINFNGNNSVFDNGNTAPRSYFWSLGNADTTNYISNTTELSLTFQYNGNGGNSPQGTYTVFLVIKQGLCMDTTSTIYNVVYNPPPPPTYNCINNIEAIIEGVSQVFIEQNTPTVVTYQGNSSVFDITNSASRTYFWSLENPDTVNVFSNTENASLTFSYRGLGGYLPQGAYDIYLIIKQGYCIDTAFIKLDVTHFFIPNLVTPNDDNMNDLFEITNTVGRFNVEVYNRWGDRVHKESGYTNGWDVKNVNDGIYYFQIEDVVSSQKYKGWVQIVH